ncbi:MAG TPA: ECF-type sigma factor [Gemmatimonadaceae bacterium]|jgi:RNA polymerase sigma factor (TIGR02999 family)|nr:ECF-type sigma factor [Gemmatimonadaceae bacterium]
MAAIEPPNRITAVLLQADALDASAAPLDLLLPLVYDELREMAGRRLRQERGDVTISPTELVHEAYLRLGDTSGVTARGRAYFFAAAAQAMRRIIVDHARRRGRQKRGGGERVVTLDEGLALIDGAHLEVLDLEDGLEQLTAIAERAARVVECRFYGGLSVDETADSLGITTRTVNRDWQFARAWLHDYLKNVTHQGRA